MDKSGFESCISKMKRKDSLLNTQKCASFKILCPYATSFIYIYVCFHRFNNLNIFRFTILLYTSTFRYVAEISNSNCITKIIIHCLFTYSFQYLSRGFYPFQWKNNFEFKRKKNFCKSFLINYTYCI